MKLENLAQYYVMQHTEFLPEYPDDPRSYKAIRSFATFAEASRFVVKYYDENGIETWIVSR